MVVVNDSWAQLRAEGLGRRVSAGESVFVDGDPPRTLVLVAAGLLKVVAVRPDGSPVTVALCGAGEVHVGPVTPAAAASSHLVAVVPTDIVIVNAARLGALIRRTPHLFLPVLGVAERQLRAAEGRAAELVQLSAPDRVRRTLTMLARRFPAGRDAVVVLPIRQDELADLSGVSRVVAARTLRALRENGCIRTARFRIDLVHPDRINSQ